MDFNCYAKRNTAKINQKPETMWFTYYFWRVKKDSMKGLPKFSSTEPNWNYRPEMNGIGLK